MSDNTYTWTLVCSKTKYMIFQLQEYWYQCHTRCAYAGFTVPNAEKKGLVQRLAVVDRMLTRLNKELGNQQNHIKKLQVKSIYVPSAEHQFQVA